jgi:hypothetical protein
MKNIINKDLEIAYPHGPDINKDTKPLNVGFLKN